MSLLMTIDRTPIATGLPILLEDLKQRLRIDFPDDDALLARFAEAAASEVEEYSAVALLTQQIIVTVINSDPHALQLLPVGPVLDTGLVTLEVDGQAFTEFEVVADLRPIVLGLGEHPELFGSRLTFSYQAGFGADASAIPADLKLAIADQAYIAYHANVVETRQVSHIAPSLIRAAHRYRGVRL